MKKILFSMAVIAATFLASCSKDSDSINQELTTPTKGSVANITFSTSDTQTRSFLDDMNQVQEWEKDIKFVTIYVYDSQNNFVTRQQADWSELSEGTISFSLPGISSGDRCTFYAAANIEIDEDITSREELLALTEGNISDYNGEFSSVISGAARANGFSMSGSSTITIASAGYPNNLTMNLKRNVAKFAVQTTISPSFVEQFSGTFKVNNISLKGSASESFVMPLSSPYSGPMNYTFTQEADEEDGIYRNLFYLYEFYSMISPSGTILTVNLLYDADGDLTTTNDQTPSSFSRYLPSSIKKNDYFKINCVLNGITGEDPNISFNIIDWATGQNVNIDEDIYVDIH